MSPERRRGIARLAGFATLAVAIVTVDLVRQRGPKPIQAARRGAVDIGTPWLMTVLEWLDLADEAPDHGLGEDLAMVGMGAIDEIWRQLGQRR